MAQATTTRNVVRSAPTTQAPRTLSALGKAVGSHDAKQVTLEESAWAHKAYVKASDEVKKEMRAEFVLAYTMARISCSRDFAETVLAQKRTERSAVNEKAVNAAGQKFTYHVSRKTVKHEDKAPIVNVKTTDLTEDDEAQIVKAMHIMTYTKINETTLASAIAYLQAYKRKLGRAAK